VGFEQKLLSNVVRLNNSWFRYFTGNQGAGEVLVYELVESQLILELAVTLTAPDGDVQDLFGSAMDMLS